MYQSSNLGENNVSFGTSRIASKAMNITVSKDQINIGPSYKSKAAFSKQKYIVRLCTTSKTTCLSITKLYQKGLLQQLLTLRSRSKRAKKAQ